jgi:hypothetical protein
MAGDRPARWPARRYRYLDAIRLMHSVSPRSLRYWSPPVRSRNGRRHATDAETRRRHQAAHLRDDRLRVRPLRGKAAVRRLNHLHQRFAISNDDYLYVLGAFIFMPARWLDQYAWRPLWCHERQATHAFYRELGRQMNVKHIPPSYPEAGYTRIAATIRRIKYDGTLLLRILGLEITR